MFEWFRINSEEIASWGIIAFSLIGAIPLISQTVFIWLKKKEKGRSVSVVWFCYSFFLSIVILLYAYGIDSNPFKINGSVRAIVHLPLLLGLWVRKGFTKSEKVIFVLLFLFTGSVFFFPDKGIPFFLMSTGMILATLKQPHEIYQNKSVGLVRVEVIILYLVGNAFWIFYAFASDKGGWVLQAVSISACVSLVVSLLVWVKYRRY